jgi:hypothetical protein
MLSVIDGDCLPKNIPHPARSLSCTPLSLLCIWAGTSSPSHSGRVRECVAQQGRDGPEIALEPIPIGQTV